MKTLLMLCGIAILLLSCTETMRCQQSATTAANMTNDHWLFTTAGEVGMWLSNNGRLSHNPLSDGAGFEWPVRSAKYVMFSDGLVFGGLVQGEVRIGGATYNSGLQAGVILPSGLASNPSDPRFRVYCVRDVDAAEYASLSVNEQERLRRDFEEWPAKDGAPYADGWGDGVYGPDFIGWMNGAGNQDTPEFKGKEVCWYVANDLNPSRTNDLYGSSPMGIETQVFTWCSPGSGPVGRAVYTRFTLINKGASDIENAYVARWADPDLGDAFDDFVGVDTTLNMMYCYNGNSADEIYGSDPPAVGVIMLQTPIVPDPSERARYGDGLREGYRNLPLSSFAFYINGSPVYADPQLRSSIGSVSMYNYMRGMTWNGRTYIDPTDGSVTVFPLNGDPVTNTGWVDGQVHSPGDRRMLLSCGPFQFAVGDTQEVVTVTLVARGDDRLASVERLRSDAASLLHAYRSVTDVRSRPARPLALTLQQNYPNPFGPGSFSGSEVTNISFNLERAGHAELSVYDALGRKLRTISSGHRPAGTYTEVLRAESLPPGTYFCRLHAGGEVHTRRMVLLR